jgi:signal transduction histidine kinase
MSESIAAKGLQFFGTMIASISHEMKNRMAIINENAGLLEDLVQMHESGRPLSPERLTRLAGAIKSQIANADGIIKKLNRLAHSVDDDRRSTEVGDTLSLTAALFQRLAGQRAIKLEALDPPEPVTVTTSPFFLIYLIGSCLDAGIQAGEPDQTLSLDCARTPDGAEIRLTGAKPLNLTADALMTADRAALAAQLGAEVTHDSKGNRILIRIPKHNGSARPVISGASAND